MLKIIMSEKYKFFNILKSVIVKEENINSEKIYPFI
jgi:hypothetical protein